MYPRVQFCSFLPDCPHVVEDWCYYCLIIICVAAVQISWSCSSAISFLDLFFDSEVLFFSDVNLLKRSHSFRFRVVSMLVGLAITLPFQFRVLELVLPDGVGPDGEFLMARIQLLVRVDEGYCWPDQT